MLGRYTADIAISYGTTGQAIVETVSFWVIPYKIIAVGLIAAATLLYVLRGLIKRYNASIIKASRRKQK